MAMGFHNAKDVVFQLTGTQRAWLEKIMSLNRTTELHWWFDMEEALFVMKVLGTDAYDIEGQAELNRLVKYYTNNALIKRTF